MDIKLWTSFAKRVNSTKVPTDDSAISIQNVKLKNRTSLYSPSFLLLRNTIGAISPTYLKWEDRYYYVDDVMIVNNDIVELSCSLDVLATCKSAILDTSAFVLYSSSNYDSDIPDPRLSTDKEAIYGRNSYDLFPNSDECWVVTHVGRNPTTGRGDFPSMIVTSSLNLNTVLSAVSSESFLKTLVHKFTDIDNYITKSLSDSYSAISNIIQMPFTPTTYQDSHELFLSEYGTGVQALVPNRVYTFELSVAIPWNFSDFRNRAQYTSIVMYLPGIGVIDLNADDYNGKSSITLGCAVDFTSGTITYRLDDIAKYNGRVGSDIPISVSRASGGVIANALTTIGNAQANRGLETIKGVFNTAQSILSRNVGTIGSSGGIDNMVIGRKVVIQCITHTTNVSPTSMATNYGRPLNAVRQINGLNGYVQTANASVSVDYPSDIKEQINNYLNGGVYIE